VYVHNDYNDSTHEFKCVKINRRQKLPKSSAGSQFICSDTANGFSVLLLILFPCGAFRLHASRTVTSDVHTFV
jgi:hypothetical protein